MRESCVNFQILLIQSACVLIKFKSTYESCDPKILLQKKAVGLLKLKLYFISLVDQLSRW